MINEPKPVTFEEKMKKALDEVYSAKLRLQAVIVEQANLAESQPDILKPFNSLYLILEDQEDWAEVRKYIEELIKAIEEVFNHNPEKIELDDLLKKMTQVITEVEDKWIGPIEISD